MFANEQKSFTKYFVIFLFFTASAMVFTLPLIFKLTTHGFGVDEDAPYHIWHNWWLKFSLFNLKQNPLRTDFIFHPQEINLIYDANSFVFGALTLPLQFVFSVLTASNIVFLLSFALSGLSMFILIKHLTGNQLISLFSGFVFAFTPYTLAQAMDGHTNLTTTWIIPLYTLTLLRSLDSNRQSTTKFQIIGGALAALQLYSDFTYTAFLIMETGFIISFFLVRGILVSTHQKFLDTTIRIIVSGAVITITAAIIGAPLLAEAATVSKTGFRVGSPLWVQNEWSADLLAYFRPSDRSTFFKNISYTPPRGTVEGTVFLGYSIITLFIISLLSKIIRRKETKNFGTENLWSLLSLAFFLLSLGPALHFNGKFQFNALGLKDIIFPLPWILLHKIPLVGETQEPSRLNPFLAMSAITSVSFFLQRVNTKGLKKSILILVLTAIVLLEYFPFPFPVTDTTPPNIYRRIGSDRRFFSVLTLPLGFNSGNLALGQSPIGSLQYFQSIHQHPSFRGTVARLPLWAFDYYRNLPLIKYLIDPSKTPDANDLDKNLAYTTFKNRLHISYIVIHKNKYENENYKKVGEILSKTLPLEFLDEDEKTISYKLR